MSSRADPVPAVGILHQVASVLNEEPDVVAAMNRVLPRLTAALGLKTAWMFLFQPDGRTVAQIASTGLPPALAVRRRAPLRHDTCFCQDAFRSGHLTRAVNMVECSRLRQAVGDKGNLVLHASVPLTSKGERLGILNVAGPGRDLFGRASLEVLSAVGQQVAVAVERTRLYREAGARARRLAALEQAVANLQSVHTPDELADRAVAAVTGPLGAARACLWLQAPQPGSQFRRVPARGRTPALLAQEPPAGPVPSASPWHPGGTGLGRLFPLQAAGSVSGVLAVAWGREESPEEIAAASPILASYATHLALALANAVLLEETERLGALMERQRLARELHDAVSQTLFSSTLTLATAERLVADGSAEGPLVLSQARGQVQRALAEMRAMIYELAPPDDDSLASALRRLAAEAGGLVTLEHSAPEPAHFEVRAALRRIAQEAVQNALRHAPGRPVRVVCTGAEDRMTLTVSDDGPGFAPDSPSAGLGMRHMRDRAAAIGAHLSVLTAPGGGTTIRVEWSESHPRAGGREVLS